MSRRKPIGSDNRETMDKFAFRQNDTDGSWERAVFDETAHEKLDSVLDALNGLDTTATVYNLEVVSAGTEENQVLPANTKSFLIRSRNKGQIRLAYASGGTSSAYLTIPVGASFEDRNFYQNLTLYFQTSKPGDIIEIVAYT